MGIMTIPLAAAGPSRRMAAGEISLPGADGGDKEVEGRHE